jgi:hypothetical protein
MGLVTIFYCLKYETSLIVASNDSQVFDPASGIGNPSFESSIFRICGNCLPKHAL